MPPRSYPIDTVEYMNRCGKSFWPSIWWGDLRHKPGSTIRKPTIDPEVYPWALEPGDSVWFQKASQKSSTLRGDSPGFRRSYKKMKGGGWDA